MTTGVHPLIAGRDGSDPRMSMRRANLRRALQLIIRSPGTQTRAGIARATGLTPATASSLVAELLESRLIVEGEKAASTGGKRATTLSVEPEIHLILIVDIRVDHAHITARGLDGTEVDVRRVTYSSDMRDRALDELSVAMSDEFGDRLLAVGLLVPGTIDCSGVGERVRREQEPASLIDRFERRLMVPVLLVHDVDAEALAEAGRDESSTRCRLYIHIGVGLGAAVTLDGDLALGQRSGTAQIGHAPIAVGDGAPACRCGRRGCLVSVAAMCALLGDEFSEGLTAAEIGSLVERADPRRLDEGAAALARAITVLGSLLDPMEAVIGGPATALGPSFLHRVRGELDALSMGGGRLPVRYAAPETTRSVGAARAVLAAVLGVRV